MSDLMTCMPFGHIMNWIKSEKEQSGTIFGVHKFYKAKGEPMTIFGRPLETEVGPAAGPNSQLAQNIIASYVAGARFFELKTVQMMDGRELAACVAKPCIRAEDECFNCEWSTELTLPEAQEEYIKAWFALHVLAKEYGLGRTDGFQFNISVGYTLDGVKTEKVTTFVDNMMEAKDTPIFKECKAYLLEHIDDYENFTKEDVEAIRSDICNSATISTLHGCPPHEIESIANYLILEKHLHTFIKCNPTLLGYDFARKTMDDMGFDQLVFGAFHFNDDLQYNDAVPMLQRLMKLCDEKGLEFGVKLTNTFPVDVRRNELPAEEMYMAGKALYPLTINLAAKLSKDFDGKLRIAYSGGADYFNIDKIVGCGIWPVTMATTLLKPGGYNRFVQIADKLDERNRTAWDGIDVDALTALAKEALTDPHHTKAVKPAPSRKIEDKVPLIDCFMAPCEATCPINQDISTYMMLAGEGKYEDAFRVILERNALPFITGTICAHPCQGSCTRNFYETPVQIRDTKLKCAESAFDAILPEVAVKGSCGAKAAIVGGGPAGMAAAYYLARAGVKVTLFEKEDKLGGIVSKVIPDFRIDQDVIDKDAVLLEKLGVDVRLGAEAPAVADLKKDYDAVVLAVGASKRSTLKLDDKKAVNALDFLEEFNAKKGAVDLGKKVVVIGGGNTAMDTARAAKRCDGVAEVDLVYRRSKRYMPADEHELLLAVEDGVIFKEQLAPFKMEDGAIICHVTKLGEPDASGRAGVVETDEEVKLDADTVIAAIGEKVPGDFYKDAGLDVDEKGRPVVDPTTMKAADGVYVIGDGLYGPKLVVTAMEQAMAAAEDIIGAAVAGDVAQKADEHKTIRKKGILAEPCSDLNEGDRCLSCSTICENCVDVCPNRANKCIKVPGFKMAQILHVDYMCNECGNCETFCPYTSGPYKDKWTLYKNIEEFEDSKNNGFVVLDKAAGTIRVRLDGEVADGTVDSVGLISAADKAFFEAIMKDYSYLII